MSFEETDDVLYLGLKNSPEALLKIVRVDTAATLTAGFIILPIFCQVEKI